MGQKVITAVVKAAVGKDAIIEHEFPQLKAALDEGYFVKDVHQSVIQSGQNMNVGYITLTFLLDK